MALRKKRARAIGQEGLTAPAEAATKNLPCGFLCSPRLPDAVTLPTAEPPGGRLSRATLATFPKGMAGVRTPYSR